MATGDEQLTGRCSGYCQPVGTSLFVGGQVGIS